METLLVPPRTPQAQPPAPPHQRGHRHRRSAAISGDFDLASFQQPLPQPAPPLASKSMPSSPLKPTIPLSGVLGSPKLFITEETRYSYSSSVPDAVIDLGVINKAQKDFIMEEEDDDTPANDTMSTEGGNELVPNFTDFEMLAISNSSSSSLNNPPFNTPSTGSLKARYQSYYKIGTPTTPIQQTHRSAKKPLEVKSPFQYQSREYNPPVEEPSPSQPISSPQNGSPRPHSTHERTSSLFSMLSKHKKMAHKNRSHSIIEQTTSEELLDSTLADITITEDTPVATPSKEKKNKRKGVWSWIKR